MPNSIQEHGVCLETEESFAMDLNFETFDYLWIDVYTVGILRLKDCCKQIFQVSEQKTTFYIYAM